MSIKLIDSGVCSPQGFLKSNITSEGGIGLSLIYTKKLASAAAILTSNKVKSSSLLLSKKNLENGRAQAIILTEGSANTCTKGGYDSASDVASSVGKALKISPKNVAVSSSGEIGKDMEAVDITNAIPALVEGLTDGITTDFDGNKHAKECAVSFEIDGKTCRMGGVAAGTDETIVFITTDCAISSEMLFLALSADVQNTLDLVNADGKSTPSDIVLALANGKAKNKEITKRGKDFAEFVKALNTLNRVLTRKIAADYKGATKIIECTVSGAKNEAAAKSIAKGIVCAPSIKASIFSALPCWGLILSTVGAAGAEVDPTRADISFISGKGEIPVCSGGVGVQFSVDFAKEILSESEITIAVKLGDGVGEATAWGSDMSYDYIKCYSGEEK